MPSCLLNNYKLTDKWFIHPSGEKGPYHLLLFFCVIPLQIFIYLFFPKVADWFSTLCSSPN